MRSRNTLSILFLGLLTLASLPLYGHSVAKRYPHVGRFRYTGTDYVQAYFTWHSVGGWEHSTPGFELDLTLVEGFFKTGDKTCTSWTNLPDYYDDCPTAGKFEEQAGKDVYSFGTYSAKQIQAGTEYRGYWVFWEGSLSETSYTMGWQEVKKKFCFWNSPSCMGGVSDKSAGVLTDEANKFKKQTAHRRRWWWTDNSAAAGAWKTEPEGNYYNSEAGKHVGYLKGPSGTDFDLYLFKWDGSRWQRVAGASTSSNIERVEYNGTAGYYTWNVNAYSGSGSYQLGIDYPSPPGTTSP